MEAAEIYGVCVPLREGKLEGKHPALLLGMKCKAPGVCFDDVRWELILCQYFNQRVLCGCISSLEIRAISLCYVSRTSLTRFFSKIKCIRT